MQFSDTRINQALERYITYMKANNLPYADNRFMQAYDVFTKTISSQDFSYERAVQDKRFLNSLYDLSALTEIFEIVEPSNNELIEQVKKMSGGVFDLENETTSNNEARNFQTELNVYAMAKRAQLDVKGGDTNTDVLVRGKTYRYAIECKRIFTRNPRAVEASIKKAVEQLESVMKDDENVLGIIWLDVSRRINIDNHTVSVEAAGFDDTSIRDTITEEMRQIHGSYTRFFKDINRAHSRITHVILSASVIGLRTGDNIPSYNQYERVIYLGDDTPYKRLLEQSVEKNLFQPISSASQGEVLD